MKRAICLGFPISLCPTGSYVTREVNIWRTRGSNRMVLPPLVAASLESMSHHSTLDLPENGSKIWGKRFPSRDNMFSDRPEGGTVSDSQTRVADDGLMLCGWLVWFWPQIFCFFPTNSFSCGCRMSSHYWPLAIWNCHTKSSAPFCFSLPYKATKRISSRQIQDLLTLKCLCWNCYRT